jgi:hypothetical protein
MGSWNETALPADDFAMPGVARGNVEQLPSGSFRAVVYAGVDPLTRRPVYVKATARTDKQAQVELGKLLGKAAGGRRRESEATVARLLEGVRADRRVGPVHPGKQPRVHTADH